MKSTSLLLLILCIGFHYSTTAQLPKGDRILAWQVDAAEDNDFASAFDYALTSCMESIHISITWSSLETEPGVFNPLIIEDLLDVANLYFPPNDVKVEFQIAVTNTVTKELPPDLSDLAFDDPVLISRFKTALDTIFAHIPDLEISAINIGNESDILFGTDESQYIAFKNFLNEVIPYAKDAYFDLYGSAILVGTTLTLDGLTDPAREDFCQNLNENLDIVSVTYYPLAHDFTMQSPEVVEGDFDELVARYSDVDQPIYFVECGYASSETCNSSEALQAEFFSEVFAVWDKHYDNIKYLSIFKTTDWSYETIDLLSEYYDLDDPIFLEYLRTLGVRTWNGEGTNKLAYEFILCELEARDWCDVDCALTEIEANETPISIRLYPNPATEKVIIQSDLEISKIVVSNSIGDVMLTTMDQAFSVSAWPTGVYMVQLLMADQTFSNLKFVKH